MGVGESGRTVKRWECERVGRQGEGELESGDECGFYLMVCLCEVMDATLESG